MILDDHEIEDNWPANKSKNDDYLYKNLPHWAPMSYIKPAIARRMDYWPTGKSIRNYNSIGINSPGAILNGLSLTAALGATSAEQSTNSR